MTESEKTGEMIVDNEMSREMTGEIIDEKPLTEYSFCKWLICDREGNILDLRTDIPSMALNEFYGYAVEHSLTPFVEKYEMLQIYKKENEAWFIKTLILFAIFAVAGRYVWNHFL